MRETALRNIDFRVTLVIIWRMSPIFLDLPSTPAAQSPVHAEEFRSGLRDRFIGGLVNFPVRTWQCILVNSGSITRLGTEEPEEFHAPAVVWALTDSEVRVRAKAGSSGAIMVIGETTLSNAIGHKPEAAALRLMSARRFSLDLSGKDNTKEGLLACFRAIFQELEDDQAGMETVIEAQIRIMLVSLWRSGLHAKTADLSNTNLMLEGFRHLLETHFRERWPVGRYATELGMSPDRLHDICTRTLGNAPQRLIQERLTIEAQVLLERSHQTLEQIADYLGFRSAPQFSAFFKTQTGFPPGAYRKAIKQKDKTAELVQSRTYADWP